MNEWLPWIVSGYWIVSGVAIWIVSPLATDMMDLLFCIVFGGFIFPARILAKLIR